MIVNTKTKVEGSKVSIVIDSIQRESWKEYFVIRVNNIDAEQISFSEIIKPGYLKAYDEWDTCRGVYVLFLIYPFVKAWLFIWRQWWNLGRACKHRGWLSLTEGQAAYYFWPVHFNFVQWVVRKVKFYFAVRNLKNIYK